MQYNYKKQIHILVNLQEIEIRKKAIASELAAFPQKMADLDRRLAESEQALSDADTRLQTLQKTYRAHDAEVQENLDKIRKRKARLNSLKSNKEYQTTLHEIEELQKKNSRIEDDMLDVLDQSETAEEALCEIKAGLTGIESDIASDKALLKAAAAEREQEMAALQEQWNRVSEDADPELLKLFETLKSKTGATAMAQAKNAVCLGCHMNIPPQLYNELQRFDNLYYCPFCQRLLYWKNDSSADEN